MKEKPKIRGGRSSGPASKTQIEVEDLLSFMEAPVGVEWSRLCVVQTLPTAAVLTLRTRPRASAGVGLSTALAPFPRHWEYYSSTVGTGAAFSADVPLPPSGAFGKHFEEPASAKAHRYGLSLPLSALKKKAKKRIYICISTRAVPLLTVNRCRHNWLLQ